MLSLGGGAVLRPENVAAVKETGLLIHLDTPFYRILKNLSYSNSRPLLNRPDKQAETRRLYNARKSIYHRVSDTSVRSPKLSEVLDKVVKAFNCPWGKGLLSLPSAEGKRFRRSGGLPPQAMSGCRWAGRALPPSGSGDAVSTAGGIVGVHRQARRAPARAKGT